LSGTGVSLGLKKQRNRFFGPSLPPAERVAVLSGSERCRSDRVFVQPCFKRGQRDYASSLELSLHLHADLVQLLVE
jgi:hypothetical protein